MVHAQERLRSQEKAVECAEERNKRHVKDRPHRAAQMCPEPKPLMAASAQPPPYLATSNSDFQAGFVIIEVGCHVQDDRWGWRRIRIHVLNNVVQDGVCRGRKVSGAFGCDTGCGGDNSVLHAAVRATIRAHCDE
jgi:hypothetical protein